MTFVGSLATPCITFEVDLACLAEVLITFEDFVDFFYVTHKIRSKAAKVSSVEFSERKKEMGKNNFYIFIAIVHLIFLNAMKSSTVYFVWHKLK